MAKITGPLMSVNAQGKYAGNVIFRSTKNGSIATRFHSPNSVNPGSPSAAQLAHRALYGAAVAAWRALSVPQQTAYDSLGKPESLSGWNYFLREQMLTPLAYYTDNFDRPDENPLAAPWGVFGSLDELKLVGLEVVISSASYGNNISLYNAAFNDDQFGQATISAVGSILGSGVMLRSNAGGDGYIFTVGGTSAKMFAFNSGVSTFLDEVTGLSNGVGDIIKFTAIGNDLKGYINGSNVLSFTSSLYSSGVVGLFAYRPGTALDLFSAGDL